MKIFKNRRYRTLPYLLLSTLALLWSSCEEDQITYPDAVEQQIVDSYLRLVTPVVGFQAGTEKYGFTYDVINGEKAITTVNVYSTFTDAVTGFSSNTVLLTSIPVEGGALTQQTDTVTYEDLRAGLLVDGDPLPESDIELAVGSGWALQFEGILATGGAIPLAGTINIAVLSRFAGIYKFTYIEYWRIGVLRNDVSDPAIGSELFIGSVDEDTFSHNDYWGPLVWTGCSFNFDVNFNNNSITVPILTPCGLFSGDTPLSCPSFSSITVPCSESNILIPNDVTSKHVIKMSYGYQAATGPREFYCEYEKVLD